MELSTENTEYPEATEVWFENLCLSVFIRG